MSRPDELIATLGLRPHPEGGWYAEVFRSASTVQPGDARGTRSALTTIYFLLTAGQTSRLHRVASDEVWHFYEGDPLELTTAPGDLSALARTTLGPAAEASAPVFTVPAGVWQGARPLGAYTLAGCSVGPGFDFADFEMLDAAVRPIAAADTLQLRQQVLRPLHRPEELVFDCDAHPDAAHFGAFHRGQHIGITTIAPAPMPGVEPEADVWQMRGMAVLPGAQGQGVGRQLVDASLAHLQERGARRLWFNARTGARPFYEKLGFEAVGREFDVPAVGPHFVMTRRLEGR
jgi:predicted cupin superfamily sugar epimerase/predicted GNAT family N-acyltransferase